jgi:membrane protease YdiL (CAAX protease family)
VLKWYQVGELEAHGGLLSAALGQFFPMLLVGFAWGYFYLKTGSLWVSWIVHFLNNTMLNLVHIRTIGGPDGDMSMVGPVSLAVVLLSIVVVKVLAERLELPEVKPWGQWMRDDLAAEA